VALLWGFLATLLGDQRFLVAAWLLEMGLYLSKVSLFANRRAQEIRTQTQGEKQSRQKKLEKEEAKQEPQRRRER